MTHPGTRTAVDAEIFSPINISPAGHTHFVAHPDAELLVISFAWRNAVGMLRRARWRPGEPLPKDVLRRLAAEDAVFVAHNVGIDHAAYERWCMPTGFPPITREQCSDTAARCGVMGIKRDLDSAAKILGVEKTKDPTGKKGIKLFAQMQRPSPKARRQFEPFRIYPEDKPEEFEGFCVYCDIDAEVCLLIDEDLPELTRWERRVWLTDWAVNSRGVLADVALARKTLPILDRLQADLERRFAELVVWNGIPLTPGQIAKYKQWLAEQGVQVTSLKEDKIRDLLPTLEDGPVKESLIVRLEAGKAGWKKVYALVEAAGEDSRLRDMLMYHGAATGRWKGTGFQPHNLARPTVSDEEIQCVLAMLDAEDYDGLRCLFGDRTSAALSSSVRAFLMASPGKKLLICDLSGIEYRVLMWFAGIPIVKGQYEKMASAIFGIPLDRITKDSIERQVGKAVTLGSGYQLGWKKLIQQVQEDTGFVLTAAQAKRAIAIFRGKNKSIVQLWADLEKAAGLAVLTGKPQPIPLANGTARYEMSPCGRWLWLTTPSGRQMSYYSPRVSKSRRYGQTQLNLSWWGVESKSKKWMELSGYGGRYTEHLVSSTSRDLLARALVRAEEAGLNPVLSVHDEIVCEADGDRLEDLRDIMVRVPVWAPGLEIEASAMCADRFGK